jgi:site-specific recombinase XerD
MAALMAGPDFPALLTTYLTSYLPRTRGCSLNTIRSYRDTFILLLRYLAAEHSTNPDQVGFGDLTANRIEMFTKWLHEERGSAPATVNQRLAAIKSFLRFAQSRAPELISQARPVLAMPATTTPHPEIAYLTTEAIKLLLEHAQTAGGLRDLALLTCIYDTAARVQEIADLSHGDLHVQPPVTVTVTGKGRKTRTIPLTGDAAAIVARHAKSARSANPTDPLFTSRRGARLSRAGIAAILARHAASAHAANPQTVPEHVTPHALRHSRAMHLLEDGVNLIYIRDLLGHASVTTTEIYAKTNPELKRVAIEKAARNVVLSTHFDDATRNDLLTFLTTIV